MLAEMYRMVHDHLPVRAAMERVIPLSSWLLPRRDPSSRLILQARANYSQIFNLYAHAKQDQWNAATDIHWDQTIKFTPKQREAASKVLSQFYWGEQGALLVSAQLAQMVKDLEAREFLASQVFDEARHVETFARLLERYDRVYPVDPALATLLEEIFETPFLEEKLIGMNLLVEGLALSSFQAALRARPDPLVTEVLGRIVRDEARHVGFGVQYLPGRLRPLSFARRAELIAKQLRWFYLLRKSVLNHRKEARLFGFDPLEIVEDILDKHEERIRRMGVHGMVTKRLIDWVRPLLETEETIGKLKRFVRSFSRAAFGSRKHRQRSRGRTRRISAGPSGRPELRRETPDTARGRRPGRGRSSP